MYSQEPFRVVYCSQIGQPPGVSPVTQTVCCVIPCCSYSWSVLYARKRDNSSAGDKSLVALGFQESAPPRVLHSCLSLPTGAITVCKRDTAPSPHTCRKRPCVSTGQPWFAHKQNTDFFAGPSFEKLHLHGGLSFGQHLAYRIRRHLLHVSALWTLLVLDKCNSVECSGVCSQCTLLVITLHTTALCFLLMASRHSFFRNKSNP
jgi:hypothetical protein